MSEILRTYFIIGTTLNVTPSTQSTFGKEAPLSLTTYLYL